MGIILLLLIKFTKRSWVKIYFNRPVSKLIPQIHEIPYSLLILNESHGSQKLGAHENKATSFVFVIQIFVHFLEKLEATSACFRFPFTKGVDTRRRICN